MCQTLQRTIPGFGLPALVPTEPSPVECDGCGALKRPYNLHEVPNNTNLCEECFAANWCECEGCGDVVAIQHSCISESGNGPFCGPCYDDRYTQCDCCGGEVHRDDTRRDGCVNTFCEECYWDIYTLCDGCGDEVNRNNAIYHDYGTFCEGCAPCGDGDISAKPFPFMHDDTDVRIGSLRTFGVELETAECDGYMELDGITHFDSKDDGSIDGKEFVSAVLRGDRGLDAIAEFCHHARYWSVDRKCGYHLHIGCQDMTDEELKSVCAAYYLTAQVWQSFVSRSRRNNGYCGDLEWDVNELDDVSNFAYWALGQNRYQWLNVSAYAEHRTLEVRLHSGTLDASKICNWVRAHIKFVDYVSRFSYWKVRDMFEGRSKVEIFNWLASIWNDAELTEYYIERARKHGTEYRAALAS